jgi:hypothetical protein
MSRRFRILGGCLVAAALAMFMSAATVSAHGGGGGGGGGGHGGGGWGGGGRGFSGGGWSGSRGYSGGNFSGRSFSTPGTGRIQANSLASHNFNSANFVHNNFGHGNWAHDYAHHGGEWWHNNWNHWNHWGWWGWGGFWPFYWYPWFGFGWWPDYYAYYPDYCGYCAYGIAYPADYGTGVVAADPGAVPYGSAYAAADQGDPNAPMDQGQGGTMGEQFLAEAKQNFHDGKYPEALRMAGHAAVEMPRNPEVHNVLMATMFAAGDYRGAAMEAHAAASLGKPMAWADLYALYGNLETFTNQLRALEKFVSEHQSDPGAHFILAYQYLIMGHTAAAKDELVRSLLLAPKDRLAGTLLTQIGGKLPESVAAVQAQMLKEAKTMGIGAPQGPVPPAPAPGKIPGATPAPGG